jgi:four helix bundle protein
MDILGVALKIERFEDIKAWKEARTLVELVYAAIKGNIDFRRDFRLVSQVQAASVSCMANVAEGFSRQGDKEFIQFLFIAKSSAAEVQSHLYVALDQGYLSETDFTRIYKQAEQVSKIASGFIKYLKKPSRSTQ